MAPMVAALSGILGFISFLTALLVLDYSFLSACAVYKQMTREQIPEAQRRARVCMASNYQDCD